MSNVFFSPEYRALREPYDYLLNDEYLQETETKTLAQDFSLVILHYRDDRRKVSLPYGWDCFLYRLVNGRGEVLYETVGYEDDGVFFDWIEHSNGKRYLVFRKELYGYSVLDVDALRDYHFFPEESLRGGETFIWTGTHYNRKTDLLVVEGCFWACPSDLLVVDFSDPARVPYPEFFPNDLLRDVDYGDMEFKCWDENDDLVVRCFDNATDEYVDKVIGKEACREMLGRKGA